MWGSPSASHEIESLLAPIFTLAPAFVSSNEFPSISSQKTNKQKKPREGKEWIFKANYVKYVKHKQMNADKNKTNKNPRRSFDDEF